MEALQIRGLTKTYLPGNVKALQQADLTLEPGLFGLLGPNGAGKSTMIRILATSLTADSGSITWGDLDWKNTKQVTRKLGYLPQNFQFFRYLTVREALDDVALFKGFETSAARKAEVDLALERSHMTEFAKRRIGQLSGGMLRRVGIAQATLGSPPLLVVDEPSAGLDPTERIHLRKLLRDYNNGERIVIISSHIVEDIESLCDTVGILGGGKILAQGTVPEICGKAKGWVVEERMPVEAYRALEGSHTVINFRPDGDAITARYLLNEGETSDHAAEPRLEDGYMKVIGGMLRG